MIKDLYPLHDKKLEEIFPWLKMCRKKKSKVENIPMKSLISNLAKSGIKDFQNIAETCPQDELEQNLKLKNDTLNEHLEIYQEEYEGTDPIKD